MKGSKQMSDNQQMNDSKRATLRLIIQNLFGEIDSNLVTLIIQHSFVEKIIYSNTDHSTSIL